MANRVQFDVECDDWARDDDHMRLRDAVLAFCSDVGLGLDVPLYREGLAFLLGMSRQLVPIMSGKQRIGHHEMFLLREGTGLAVTALSNLKHYRAHLMRLLNATPMRGMAWVNLDMGRVSLIRLNRQNH